MLFVGGIGTGVFIDKQNNKPNPDTVKVQPGTAADFQLINQAWGLINSNTSTRLRLNRSI